MDDNDYNFKLEAQGKVNKIKNGYIVEIYDLDLAHRYLKFIKTKIPTVVMLEDGIKQYLFNPKNKKSTENLLNDLKHEKMEAQTIADIRTKSILDLKRIINVNSNGTE